MSDLTPAQEERATELGIRLGDAFLRYYNACQVASRKKSVNNVAEVEDAAVFLYRTFVSIPVEREMEFRL